MKILGLPPGFFLLFIIALAIVGCIIALLIEVACKNKKLKSASIATEPTSLDRTDAQTPDKKGSFGWAVFGFFFMPIGFILYLVWKNTKPSAAKSAGVGALIGVIACVALTLIGSFASLMM